MNAEIGSNKGCPTGVFRTRWTYTSYVSFKSDSEANRRTRNEALKISNYVKRVILCRKHITETGVEVDDKQNRFILKDIKESNLRKFS